MYALLIPILAPVFIVTLLGYGWARLGLPFHRDFVTGLVMNVASGFSGEVRLSIVQAL